MSGDIYRITSDLKDKQNITEDIRNRKLSQKYMYLEDGADVYYDYKNSFWKGTGEELSILDIEETIGESLKLLKDEGCKTSIISLACGNSEKEALLLRKYFFNGLSYIGLDFSERMLELSREKLEKFKGDYKLIRCDLSDTLGTSYINSLHKEGEDRIFFFLGNTFGNIKPTNIVDILSTYLNKGEKLLLEITVMEDNVKSSLDIFNHYKNKTKESEDWRSIILNGLDSSKFPLEKTKVVLESESDDKIGYFKIKFGIEALQDIEYKLDGNIILSKGEKVFTFELYYYIPDKLVKFMELHHFKLVKKSLKNMHGQFLFEKE